MTAWSVTVHRDGVPVTGQIPANRWEVAGIFARVVHGWTGGTVSVMAAAAEPEDDVPDPQMSIFDVEDPT